MTVAGITMGYPIYAMPDVVFSHLYKKKFNYSVSVQGQQRNRQLLDWWFLDGDEPSAITEIERDYKKMVRQKRARSMDEVKQILALL